MKEDIKDIIIKNAGGLHSNCDVSASEILDLITKNLRKKLASELTNYVKRRHNQDECLGFSDGFEKAADLIKFL